jgi:hypothetical protein
MPGQRHQTSDALIEPVPGDRKRARGRAYYTFSRLREGRLETVLTGVYETEFMEEGGRWRIDRFRGVPDRSPAG